MKTRQILAILGVVILVAGVFAAGYWTGLRRGDDTPDRFTLLRRIQQLVETRYFDRSVTELQLAYGAARGMLSALDDPYSRFMDPQTFKEFHESSFEGRFTGIGIIMDLKDGQVMVVSPIPGTPAARAGLQAGDRIVKIDGRPTREMALQRAVSLIRGATGTTVHLSVVRGDQTREVAITRDSIHAPSVSGEEVLDPAVRARLRALNVAYLRIATFNESTGDEFSRAVNTLMARSPRGLILDLRSNGGGLVESAVRVANEFVKRGPIVVTVDRDGKRVSEEATGAARLHLPLIVLVNEFTASASEIVAGALQDDHLATLVGIQTFGKGIVQTIFSLPGGSGAAITTFKYLTPSGRSIHKVGLTPDIPVGARLEGKSPEEVRRIQDEQLGRAIEVLRNRLTRAAVPHSTRPESFSVHGGEGRWQKVS
jgi:carboxyl-terminal processing protease